MVHPDTAPPSAASAADAAHSWATLARIVRQFTHTASAGVLFVGDRARSAAVGMPIADEAAAAIGARLAGATPVLHHDRRRGHRLAAVAVDPGDGPDFVWIARVGRDFEPGELAILSSLVPMATLLHRAERQAAQAELMLAELRHRCGNDLQLVDSLLRVQLRHHPDPAVREALRDIAARVQLLLHARGAVGTDMAVALRSYCDALSAQVGDRQLGFDLVVDGPGDGIGDRSRTLILIAVNELVTNAIKHAFPGHASGRVAVRLDTTGPDRVRVTVEDDGAPLAAPVQARRRGSGLDLLQRLLAGGRGRLRLPDANSKAFVIEIPPT